MVGICVLTLYVLLVVALVFVAYSLPEILKKLLSHEEAEFVYTIKFNQDPVEIFFGQQRARGRRNENPSVTQFLQNTQALMVQKSLAIGGSSNISRKRTSPDLPSLCRPLPKRRRNIMKFD